MRAKVRNQKIASTRPESSSKRRPERPGTTKNRPTLDVPLAPGAEAADIRKAKTGDQTATATGSAKSPRIKGPKTRRALPAGQSVTTLSSDKITDGESTALALSEISDEIKWAHDEVVEYGRATSKTAQEVIIYALRAGEALARAKDQIEHGQWQNWVKYQCGIALSTARDYMRLHKKRE